MSIDTSTLTTNAEQLSNCTKKNNEREQRQVEKDTQPHELVKAKVAKKTKGMFQKILRPFRSIKNRNKTLKQCEKLMMEGVDRSEFKLPEEYLHKLLPKQKMRYDAFSKKLDIIAEYIRALQSQSSRHQSNNSIADNDDSGYESEGNYIDDEHSINDANSLLSLNEPQETFTDPAINNLAPRENTQNSLLEAAHKRSCKKITTCLKNGADITVKDTSGNNILHLIVELKRKQKVESLELIADLVEQEVISQEKLGESIKAINTNGHTPLQSMLIKKITKKRYQKEEVGKSDNTLKFIAKLLELGADPCQLKLPGKIFQNLNKEQRAYYQKFREKLTKIAKNTVNIQDNNDNYLLHLAIVDNNKDLFEKLLQQGADITNQDANGNNALHYIAELEGKQKVEYLQSILDSLRVNKLEEGKNTLEKAVKTANKKGNTPIRVALKIKAEKKEKKHLKIGMIIFDPKTIYDSTIKFCATLLENGADPSSLELKEEVFHTERYYLILQDLKDYPKTPQKAREKAREFKEELEHTYKIETFSKKSKHIQKKVWYATKKIGSFAKKTGSAIASYIDPVKRTNQLLVITVTTTVITIVALAFFQGQMAVEAALSIIAVAAVMCIVFTLGFSFIKEFMKNFEGLSPNEENYNYPYREQEEMYEKSSNNREENLINNPEGQEMKNLSNQLERREILSTQSEHRETPYTKMYDVSGPTQFVDRPVTTNSLSTA